MLNDQVVSFQKLNGLKETHLQNVCLLLRQLPTLSLWCLATALAIGQAPPVAEGNAPLSLPLLFCPIQKSTKELVSAENNINMKAVLVEKSFLVVSF